MKHLSITTVLLAVSITACSLPDHNMLGYKRVQLRGVPEGNDSFSQGWRDGCDTSLATVGAGTLRLGKERLNRETVEQMVKDPLYDKGFITGSSYCTNFLDYNSG